MEIRIHWADLEALGACAPSRAAFLAYVEKQGHGEGEVLIFSEWTQAETDECLALPGGPEFLTFFEFHGLVPVHASQIERFTNPATRLRRWVVYKYRGDDGFSRVPGAGLKGLERRRRQAAARG